MTLEFKDKDQLVQDVIDSISSQIDDIDFSDGEPLRTIIEAVMNELDLQNWQLSQVYENSFIDTAYGDDLSELVKINGTTRKEAISATGKVKFYRSTPATVDYLIPVGTLVETLPDNEGNTCSYETTENVTLLTGQTEVYANVNAIEPGVASNVVINKVIVINNPPMGIESVTNDEVISGGEDEESDDDLKTRTKSALETAGQGTILALTNKILSNPGIKSVKILDMQRGIGTVDILVLGYTLPMASDLMTQITQIATDTKAGGIDVILYEPTTNTVNISMTLTLSQGTTINDVSVLVNDAINNYFSSLGIGNSLIKNQLSKEILNNTEDKVIDLTINIPSSNIVVDDNSIIILGTVTLN